MRLLQNRRKLILAGAGALVLLAAAAGVAYAVVFSGSSPQKLALSSSTATPSAPPTGSTSAYALSAASITVDVNTLSSDRSMRDQRIHRMGLESDRYPTATFVLASPITLPADAGSGPGFRVSATGSLTIHGVSRSVTIPIDARLNGS